MGQTDRNCITYWYPRIKPHVPTPQTIILPVDPAFSDIVDGWGGRAQEDAAEKFIATVESEIGWPAFVRSGLSAAKHSWSESCYWPERPSPIDACRKLYQLAEFCACADLPFTVLAARRFLPLRSAFTAFRGMPISREYRCFIEAGRVVCEHPYWPEDAIRNPSRDDWRARLCDLYADGPPFEMCEKILMVAAVFRNDGAWSVDACQTVSGDWYVTDMAVAADSFHWPGCPNEHAWERD